MEHAMSPTFRRIKNGFTLIEVMVSIVILMVGLLGLLQAVNLAMEQNMKNSIRTEAVQIAENQINLLKLAAYDNISVPYSTRVVPSNIRGVTRSYNVDKTGPELRSGSAEDIRELSVRVSWSYKNVSSNHEVRTLKTR